MTAHPKLDSSGGGGRGKGGTSASGSAAEGGQRGDIRFVLKSRGGGGDEFLRRSPPTLTGAAAAVNKRYYPLAPRPRCGTTQICWLQGAQFNNLPVLVPSHPCFRHQPRRGSGLTGGIPIDSSIGKASPPLGTTRALPVHVVPQTAVVSIATSYASQSH